MLRKHGVTVHEYNETGVTDCNNYKSFWVSWDEDQIQVGVGHEKNALPILGWSDPDYGNVGHVGFSTGYGEEGQWRFRETLGMLDVDASVVRFRGLIVSIFYSRQTIDKAVGVSAPQPQGST